MKRVLISDTLSPEGIEILKNTSGLEVDVMTNLTPDELKGVIKDYDGLAIRSATKVTKEIIEKADNLKVVGRAGIGVDNVDVNAASKRGIVVMNTPGGNTISTCEHTFALLFALCRNIPKAHLSMMEGRWDRKKFMGAELCGKTLGILGVGRIGGAVAKRAQAFEMKIIAYDPLLTQLKAEALGVELVSIDDLMERSDFISIHAPKTEKTNDLVTIDLLRRMKPTCRARS